jgi:hypothetical protein
VEKLSGGTFTAAMLIGAVCAGVGVGMVAGGWCMRMRHCIPRQAQHHAKSTFKQWFIIAAAGKGAELESLPCLAGSLKILYSLPLIYFLLAKYAVAVMLTIVTEDSITAVAWCVS